MTSIPSSSAVGSARRSSTLAEGRASELGASAVRNDVFARDQGAISLLESRGYRPVRRYYEMRIDARRRGPAGAHVA